MTANNSKFYLSYLNKIVDEYNDAYHRSIGKKPIDAIILLCLKKSRQIRNRLN